MTHTVKLAGVCSSRLTFDIADDGTLHNVAFTGGCDGNLKAVGKLVEGMPADRVADLLAGNTCGMKRTSCADQLAKAIRSARA